LKRRAVFIILIAAFAILLVAGIRFGEIGDIYTNGRFL
jgi:hypothetical protein